MPTAVPEFRFGGAAGDNSVNSYTPKIDLTNPQGITGAQRAVLAARIGKQNETATGNAIAGMLGRYGGNSSSAGMVAATARLRAGAGSATAENMANIDIAEVRNQQDLTMKNKALGLQAEGIGAQREASNLGYQSDMAGIGMRQKELDANMAIKMRELDDAMTRFNKTQSTQIDQYATDREDRLSASEQNFQLALATLMATKTAYGVDGPNPGLFTEMMDKLWGNQNGNRFGGTSNGNSFGGSSGRWIPQGRSY